MSRTVVLLDKTKTYVTDSNHVQLEFPATGDMQTECPVIEWDLKSYNYFDHPVDESDEPGAELYRYVEAGA